MKNLIEDLKLACQLYCITAIIPIILTALLLIVCILGAPGLTYGFLEL
jgi:hypothetical protein